MTSSIEKRVASRIPGLVQSASRQAEQAPEPYPAKSSTFHCIDSEALRKSLPDPGERKLGDVFFDVVKSMMVMETEVRMRRLADPLVLRELLKAAVDSANCLRGKDEAELTVAQFAPEDPVDQTESPDVDDIEIDALLPDGPAFDLLRSSNKTLRDELCVAIQFDAQQTDAKDYYAAVYKKFRDNNPTSSVDVLVEFLACMVVTRTAMMLQWTLLNGLRDAKAYVEEKFKETKE